MRWKALKIKFLSVLGSLAFLMLAPGHAFGAPIHFMTFNIWLGGFTNNEDRLPRIIRAIQEAKADIVAIQEPWRRGETSKTSLKVIAEGLGKDWSYAENSNIISRFPIVRNIPYTDPYYDHQKIGFSEIAVPHWKKPLGVCNSHLAPYPYGPYEVRDQLSVQEVDQNEGVRLNQILGALQKIQETFDKKQPVVLAGDFNTVSHLDWANHKYRWPTTRSVEAAGFVDAYRSLFPDVSKYPGYTWSPGYLNRPVNDTNDRIDFIFFKGKGFRALDAEIYDSKIDSLPWPSDHRAVTATLDYHP